MRATHFVVVAGAFGLLAGGVWLGCSSSPPAGNNGTPDSGTDAQADHAAPGLDSGSDSAGNLDTGSPQPDAAADAGTPVSCDDYCTTIQQACGPADGGPESLAQYYDVTNCKTTCALWPPGVFNDTANSVGCRQYHAHAALQNPVVHCPHAGPGGGGLCGQRCEDYCFLVGAWCTVARGASPPYSNNADCLAACAAYPYNAAGPDYDENAISTLNCLDYHLRESLSDLAGQGIDGGHCDDLSIDGGTVRGACHP
jgi:hypothetical protein